MTSPRLLFMTVAAGAGVVGVVATHSGTSTTGSIVAASGPTSHPSSSTPSSPSGTSATQHHSTTTVPGKTTPSTGRTSTPTSPPSSASSPATSPSSGTRSATGQGVNYGYGVLAVRVTVSGAKITAVSVPVLQTADQYSQQLAQQVIPMLKGEVFSAQSAKIAAVSGATYTSEAYAMSLQNALAKLHLK